MEETRPLLEWQEIHHIHNRNAIEAFRAHRADLCVDELDRLRIQSFDILNFPLVRINSNQAPLPCRRILVQEHEEQPVPAANIQHGTGLGDGVYEWSERAAKISDNRSNPVEESITFI